MVVLVKIRDWLKAFYGKFDIVIVTIIKFAIAFAALKVMSDNIGYFPLLQNPFIILVIALVCSILPYGLSALVLAVCLLVNVYKVSLEMTVIIAFILIAVALMYYSFHPGDPVVLILAPVLMALKIPYVLPLIIGLTGSFISIIPMGCGILVYYMCAYVKANANAFGGKLSLTDLPTRFMSILDGILANREMLLVIGILAVALVLVYLIHNFSFRYSWYVAVAAGIVAMIAGSAVLKIDIYYPGLILSALLAVIYVLFVFSVDYNRTERLQFEDDDYYYYVKAIPKISVNTFGDGMVRSRREYPEDAYSGNDREYPEDTYSGNDREYPEDTYSGNDREYPEDTYNGNDREYPEDAYSGNDREYPEDAYDGSGREYPEDAYNGNDREYPEDAYDGGAGAYPGDYYEEAAPSAAGKIE